MKLEDFKDRDGKWVASIKPPKSRQLYTVAGTYWGGIVSRCNPNGVQQKRKDAYKGCQNGFEDFQDFAEWAKGQKGYGIEGWDLDKDIISPGVKLYSKSSCCFVPHEINTFFMRRKFENKTLPTGVTFHKASGKYAPGLWVDGRRVHIGVFETPELAHAAYAKAKKLRAKELALKWEGIVDERIITALLEYEVPHSNNKE